MKDWTTCGLALACMLVVGWIWYRPQTLAVADALADRSVRLQVKRQMARDSLADLEARTNLWLRDSPAQVATARQTLAQRLRESMSFPAADGRRYAYLGDLDSYAWVRRAHNYLAHGTTCEEVRAGECRDSFVNPPYGIPMPYARSLHIAAIVAVQRVTSWFDPGFPLTASAAWVAILGGVLTSLLAWMVGYRLAGINGGLAAALLIPLHPFVLERSLGSDNDVWNVALPLLFAWLTATALESTERRRRWAALAGAGGVADLHAMTWNGWIFHAAVILTGAGLYIGSRLRAPAIERRQRDAALAAFALLVLTVVVAGLLLGDGANAIARIQAQLAAWFGNPVASPTSAEEGMWPPMLMAVNELAPTTFQRLVPEMLGRVGCVLCFAGFAALLLPRRAPWWGYFGAAVYGLALTASIDRPDLGSRFYISATLVPLLATVAWRLCRSSASTRPRCIDMIVAAWFIGGLLMSFRGARYVLLTVPPFALVAGVALGRSADLLAGVIARRFSHRRLVDALLTAIVIAILIPSVSQGHAAAAAYSPVLNTAWWKVLSHLRTRSAKDAIVTSWWDQGYWVKSIAERRTTADGASLLSHRPYWTARTLVSNDPQEAVGLLRMLNCGGDDTHSSADDLSAFGGIQRVLHDAVRSHALLLELVRQPPDAAAAMLAERGFSPEQQAQIVAASHCQPPESYLLLSSELAASDVWVRVGEWDFRKAQIAAALRSTTPGEVISAASERFGFSPAAATQLVEQAQRLPLFDFVSGKASRTPPLWYPCSAGPVAGSLRCAIELEEGQIGRAIEAVDVSLIDPTATRLRVSFANQTQWQDQVPAALIVAGDEWTTVPVQPDANQDLGVLVDVVRSRVMLGHPAFLASLYFRLVYLDGRYTPGFAKVMEEATPFGSRVSLWRVRFPGAKDQG